jgi:hypothetical protein
VNGTAIAIPLTLEGPMTGVRADAVVRGAQFAATHPDTLKLVATGTSPAFSMVLSAPLSVEFRFGVVGADRDLVVAADLLLGDDQPSDGASWRLRG